MVGTMYTLSEVSQMTGYSMSFLYKAVANDLISYSKPCGKIFIDHDDLVAFLRRGKHVCAADIIAQRNNPKTKRR